MDINQYIEPRQQSFLNGVEYRLLQLVPASSKNVLKVSDKLDVQFLDQKHIKLILTRRLDFEPAGLFELSASFGMILTLRDDAYYLVDWKTYDLAEEIINNSKNLLNPLAARISLLIAEITSSYGQVPIVTPPTIIHK